MPERINRRDDEPLYQPKIHADRIRELYKMGIETGLPMTVLVDYAIRSYYRAFLEQKARDDKQDEIVDRSDNEVDRDQRNDQEFTDPFEDGSLYGF